MFHLTTMVITVSLVMAILSGLLAGFGLIASARKESVYATALGVVFVALSLICAVFCLIVNIDAKSVDDYVSGLVAEGIPVIKDGKCIVDPSDFNPSSDDYHILMSDIITEDKDGVKQHTYITAIYTGDISNLSEDGIILADITPTDSKGN